MRKAIQTTLCAVLLATSSFVYAITTYTVDWQGTVNFKGWGCEEHSISQQMCSFGDVGDIFGGEIQFSIDTYGDINPDSGIGEYPIAADFEADLFDSWKWSAFNRTTDMLVAGSSYCVWGRCSIETQNSATDSLLIAEYYDLGSAAIELFVEDVLGGLFDSDAIPLGTLNLLDTSAGFSVWDELGGFSGKLEYLSISSDSPVSAVPLPASTWLFFTIAAPFLYFVRRGRKTKKT